MRRWPASGTCSTWHSNSSGPTCGWTKRLTTRLRTSTSCSAHMTANRRLVPSSSVTKRGDAGIGRILRVGGAQVSDQAAGEVHGIGVGPVRGILGPGEGPAQHVPVRLRKCRQVAYKVSCQRIPGEDIV